MLGFQKITQHTHAMPKNIIMFLRVAMLCFSHGPKPPSRTIHSRNNHALDGDMHKPHKRTTMPVSCYVML